MGEKTDCGFILYHKEIRTQWLSDKGYDCDDKGTCKLCGRPAVLEGEIIMPMAASNIKLFKNATSIPGDLKSLLSGVLVMNAFHIHQLDEKKHILFYARLLEQTGTINLQDRHFARVRNGNDVKDVCWNADYRINLTHIFGKDETAHLFPFNFADIKPMKDETDDRIRGWTVDENIFGRNVASFMNAHIMAASMP